MRVRCRACPLRNKPHFQTMSREEVDFMQEFKIGELDVEKGAVVLLEGTRTPQVFTVLEGMGLRYKTLANGRRQVLNFVFPGDFLGLQSGLMDEMQHSIEASTAMTLCVFNRKSLWRIFTTQPQRAYDLTWLAAADEHFLGDALTTIGQKDAASRLAWAIVKIVSKCRALELTTGTLCPMPFRQQDLADALGLSLVHTNKTLARFRAQQLVTWTPGQLNVTDLETLARIGMVESVQRTPRPLF